MVFSLFLAVIVDSFLLFMGRIQKPESLRTRLGLDLGDLSESLQRLQNVIDFTRATDAKIHSRVHELVRKVKNARARNSAFRPREQSPQQLEHNIALVQEVQSYILRLTRSTLSEEELNNVLGKMEKALDQIHRSI